MKYKKLVGHEEDVTRNIVFLYSDLIIVLLSRQWNRDVMDLSKQGWAWHFFNIWTLIAEFKLICLFDARLGNVCSSNPIG